MDFLERMYMAAQRRAAMLDEPEVLTDLPRRDFKAALRGLGVIAEVKYATPAEGSLGIKAAPEELACRYGELGAVAISCLTEPEYFKGSLDNLGRIRKAVDLPLLMKDFIVDERQIMHGRARGADAFLLISEMLSAEELAGLYACGQSLGMDVLVEVHGPAGLEKAVDVGAEIIGVNCRDLKTLRVNPVVHAVMAAMLPSNICKVAESGIDSNACLRDLADLNYDAVLVGRAVMNPELREEILRCG